MIWGILMERLTDCPKMFNKNAQKLIKIGWKELLILEFLET